MSRRDESNAHERSYSKTGKRIKNTRSSLLKSPAKQSVPQLALLAEVQQANKPTFRAFLLNALRLLYQLDNPPPAPAHVGAWPAWASHSKLDPFIKLDRTIRRHLRRDPPRPLQRTPRRTERPHPPDQPPQLWLPLGSASDRASLLCRAGITIGLPR
jgi:Transposase